MADQSSPNRGRIQAQGLGTEKSISWPPPNHPPTKSEVLIMLDRLHEKLTPSEQDVRKECFDKARKWILECPARGVENIPPKTFHNRKMRGGVRIDIEIILGKALLDDPISPESSGQAREGAWE